MEIEILQVFIKMVADNGISVVASVVLLYFTSKFFKENAENQKEIIQAIILVKDKLVNGHLNNEDLKIQVRLHWLKMVNIYKSNIFEYIIQNNIKKNIEQIEIELDKVNLDMINRSAELLRNQATPYNFINIMDLLKEEITHMHNLSIDILKSNIDCENGHCVDYKELARVIKNHINHIESETVIKINEMKL